MSTRNRFFLLSCCLVMCLSSSRVVRADDEAPTEMSAEAAAVMSAPTEAQPSYPNLKIGGFADFNFFATDSGNQLSNSGFSEGQFVLHFTSALSDRLGFFGELSLTARNAATFTPTVERVIVRYDHSDLFRLSMGRYHTPINWWNTAFHHGQWLQTTVARPDMTRFGGPFIPVHFVGVLAEGTHPAWGANFNYQVGIGNGREQTITQGGDAGDFNNNRAWLSTIFFRPDRFFPLQFGGSLYRDKITTAANRQVRETISSAHITWTKETPELIAEYSNVYHRDLNNQRPSNSQAWYVQAAYRLPWWKEKVKPYARYEDMDIDPFDVIYTGGVQPTRQSIIAGVRYDFAELLALKGEWRRQQTSNEREAHVNSFWGQVAYAF